MAQEHPSGDKRFRILDTVMKRHHFRSDALIEVFLGHDLLPLLANPAVSGSGFRLAIILRILGPRGTARPCGRRREGNPCA